MKYDHSAIQESQRRAYNTLAARGFEQKKIDPVTKNLVSETVLNPYYTDPVNITSPAELVQEVPFLASAGNQFSFDFSINAPIATAALNNVTLGKNNRFSVAWIKLLIGEGETANNRVYRSHGLIPNDDSIYNSIINMRFEQSTYVDKLSGQMFRDVTNNGTDFWADAGMVLIDPQRVLSGELGVFNVTINLINPISSLVLSDNLFLSMRLGGALGQAAGGR